MKIFDILKKVGIVTHKYPAAPYIMDDRFRGKPEYNYSLCIGCAACAIACPPNAISVKWKKEASDEASGDKVQGELSEVAGEEVTASEAQAVVGGEAKCGEAQTATQCAPKITAINYAYDAGRCIFCGRCDEVCPTGAIALGNEWELAVKFDKTALLQTGELDIAHCKECGKPFKSVRFLAHVKDKLALGVLNGRDFESYAQICRECKRDAVVARMAKNELEVIK